ncbi:PDDEXK nuclease domain-containing protein [Blautia wexlerae]|uniref:PDDEXK nuclease domain-containing protein n=1 Tax=Blautia wexlerae TaxID=418240 RepID=UPI0022E00695|nr:PDDEXK nuclease domain-containing protein [Blautia wexlerae]
MSDLIRSKNSEFVALLKQANTDSSKMAEVIGVSDAQLRFVTNSQSGMGLLKCGNVVIPFDNQIERIRAFIYLFYSSSDIFSEMAHTIENSIDLNSLKLQQVGAEISENQKLHQAGAEIEFPAIFGFVPWRHHVEIVKDAYDFGFVSLPIGYDEEELEDALEQNITRFLLELGSGFAFIGRQKEIIVAGKTRKIDMLFYHIKLRCYVVVELKEVSFEPEFAGKLNFYVNAVNELMKSESDNPTIGLLICKDKDQTEVQWAFQGIETPMGVATYDNIRLQEIKS